MPTAVCPRTNSWPLRKTKQDPERAAKVFAKADKDANNALSKEEFTSAGGKKGKGGEKSGAAEGE